MEQAVSTLMSHHDALRLRFERDGEEWRQTVDAVSDASPFSCCDLSELDADARVAAMEKDATEQQASLEITRGRLVRVRHYDLGDRTYLLLVVHHLAVDGVSWRVLLEDLERAYVQASRGETPHLPAKTTSFKRWAERLSEYAQTSELSEEESFWASQWEAPWRPLPVEGSGANTMGSTREHTVSLDRDETHALLRDVPGFYQTQINDVLLTALAESFCQWTGEERLRLDLEGHGREELFDDVDLSRTVGWFTTLFPVSLPGAGASRRERLEAVRARLRAIPRRGIGYGLLKYLAPASVERLVHPAPQVSFNYLGQIDGSARESTLFHFASESSGAAVAHDGPRQHLVSIDALIVNGTLGVTWTYCPDLHRRETIETLAVSFKAALVNLIAEATAPARPRLASDFPLAALDEAALHKITKRLERGERQ
jgi:non-ribosomal peptide synthase protein (TIGR01720 family)